MIKMCVYVQLGSFCVLWSFGGSLFIFQKLYPDPILKLNRIIGFGGATMRCVSNTHTQAQNIRGTKMDHLEINLMH